MGMKQRSKYSALLYTNGPQIGSKVHNIFSQVGHVAYQLKGKNCRILCKFDLMHTPEFWAE